MNIYKELVYEELCKSFKGKVELINGEMICSLPASVNHNKITIGISGKTQDFLLGKSCEVYSEQIELLLGDDRFKPDIFVVCPKDDNGILTQYKLYGDYYRAFRIYNKDEIYKSIEMEDLEIDLNRIIYFIGYVLI